jgi:hypothetical protein
VIFPTVLAAAARFLAPGSVANSPHTHSEGQGGMWDKLMSVMDNWYFIGGCILALVVLIGLYLFLKNNRNDDD